MCYHLEEGGKVGLCDAEGLTGASRWAILQLTQPQGEGGERGC